MEQAKERQSECEYSTEGVEKQGQDAAVPRSALALHRFLLELLLHHAY